MSTPEEQLASIPEITPEEEASLAEIPEITPEEEAELGSRMDLPPGAIGLDASGIPMYEMPAHLDGTIDNPPSMLEKWGPFAAETAAGLATSAAANMAAPGIGAPASGLAFTAGEQGMSQLLQSLGLKPDAPMYNDLMDAGLSGVLNTALPFGVGKIARGQALKREAAQMAGAVPEAMYQPFSNSVIGRTAAARLRDSSEWLKANLKPILRGATSFDIKTGKWGGTKLLKKGEGNLETISGNIDRVLNGAPELGQKGLIAQRDDLLGGIENAMNMFNATAKRSEQINGITAAEVSKASKIVLDKVDNFASTPYSTGDVAGAIKGEFDGVLADIAQYDGGASNTFTRGTVHGGRTEHTISQGVLSPKDANAIIGNLYERARRLQAFASDDALDEITKTKYNDAAKTVLSVVGSLKHLRDTKTEEILAKAGGLGELEGVTKQMVQNAQDGVHHLLNFKQSGVDPFVEAYGARMGARAQQTAQADNAAQTKFNQQGIFASAMDKLKSPFGLGPDTANLRLQRKVMGNLDNVAERANAGPGLMEGKVGPFFDSPAALAPNVLRRAPDEEADAAMLPMREQMLQHGVSPGKPQQVLIPRTATGIREFMPVILNKVAQEIGDPAMVQQLREGLTTGTDKERRQALGLLMRHVPEVSEFFEPSKSGFLSEIDGIIHAKEDLAAAADAIEDSDMSDSQKALAWNELWNNRRYTGKPVVTRAPLPMMKPALPIP